MGIRFLCPSCGKRINVKEQQAGLRGFCPKCGAGVDIPLESTIPSRSEQTEQEASTMAVVKTARANAASATAAAHTVDPLHEIPTALWYALPPGAPKPYGPADGPSLAQWFYEGRLSPDSMVWRQDWPEWRAVAEVWPNWRPGGPGLGEPERVIDPPPGGEAYPLKKMKAQSVSERPPVIVGLGATVGPNSRGLADAVDPTLGKSPALPSAKSVLTAASSAAIGSAAAGAGVYYRRRSNGAYLTTVVVLVLLVVALGGVMVWVIMRDPPPVAPKPKPGAAPSGTLSKSTLPAIPALDGPKPSATPTATGPKPTTTGS